MQRGNYLPGIKYSDGCTPRDRIPLATAALGWSMDDALYCVLRVLHLDVRRFTDIVRVGLNLRLHSLKIWDVVMSEG